MEAVIGKKESFVHEVYGKDSLHEWELREEIHK